MFWSHTLSYRRKYCIGTKTQLLYQYQWGRRGSYSELMLPFLCSLFDSKVHTARTICGICFVFLTRYLFMLKIPLCKYDNTHVAASSVLFICIYEYAFPINCQIDKEDVIARIISPKTSSLYVLCASMQKEWMKGRNFEFFVGQSALLHEVIDQIVNTLWQNKILMLFTL